MRTLRARLAAAGAALVLVLGALFVWPMGLFAQESQQDLEEQTKLTRAEAEQIALADYPGATVTEVELEKEHGNVHYSVEMSNGVEVEVDGNTGQILEVEHGEDDRDDGEDDADEQGDD